MCRYPHTGSPPPFSYRPHRWQVLQRLQELGTHGVCQTVATGTYEERGFIVMEVRVGSALPGLGGHVDRAYPLERLGE